MNGTEQKERRSAIERLEKLIDVSLVELREKWETELDSRIKADEHLKELFAKMVSDETIFRQRAVQATNKTVQNHHDVATGIMRGFIRMPWYMRFGWLLGGEWALTWIIQMRPRTVLKPEDAQANQGLQVAEPYEYKARAGSEKPS